MKRGQESIACPFVYNHSFQGEFKRARNYFQSFIHASFVDPFTQPSSTHLLPGTQGTESTEKQDAVLALSKLIIQQQIQTITVPRAQGSRSAPRACGKGTRPCTQPRRLPGGQGAGGGPPGRREVSSVLMHQEGLGGRTNGAAFLAGNAAMRGSPGTPKLTAPPARKRNGPEAAGVHTRGELGAGRAGGLSQEEEARTWLRARHEEVCF